MVTSPSNELREPESSEPFPNLVDLVLSFPDLISPSHWMLWAIDQVSGVNPAQWAAEWLAGDWEALSRGADALDNLAQFDVVFGSQIRTGCDAMLYDWTGNAADAAKQYFDGIPAALELQGPALERVATEFRTLAYGMWSTAKSIVSLFELLVDLLIAMALEAAAAAASSWTVIGPILSGAAFACTLTKALGVWGKAIEVHNAAFTAANVFVGVVTGYLGALRGMQEYPLPAAAYDHPGG
jgi:hypothetical protein